jgi:acyl-CoA synthetase (AMP-forming)/AMP-acid ligase II
MNPIAHLYFRANFQPDDVAIQNPGSEITWRKLVPIVQGIACKLRQIGARPNQVAVTYLPNRYLDWVVTLALMHEAVATCSTFGPLPLELEPDFVLTPKALPDLPQDKTVLVDNEWLKDMPPVPENFGPQTFASQESLFRLILTSGTTGHSKAAAFSLDAFLKRCQRPSAPSSAFAHEVCMMGLSSVLGFTVALRNLLRGTPCYFANYNKEVIYLINAYHVECLSGSPHQLGALIEEVQRTSKRPSSLKMIWYSGGDASPTLLDNVRRDLCPNVVCLYGSTEVGGVSSYLVHDQNRQPGMVGYVVPEAEVQIVNEQHHPLDAGEEGSLRVRSSSMAGGYYKNPEETNRSYRDGWFYPGDRARLLRNGMLKLTGREQELINRGGVKVSPAEIDHLVQSYEGILDAATFSFEDHQGLEDICAAVVVTEDFKMELFQRHLAQALAVHQNPTLILKLKEIPRNQMGKPLRQQMREQYGDMLRQQLRTKQ